ncbi:hypothetical protein QJS83_09265 [Bdellovibrio sp. 22V]|uniref:hypothetical protein n=1 Tax=Bdellovibrio TaxID=958 RepID=UPI0025428F55|nr:hypothetical protein [Bdellovibrio sp. 22V]WII70646.1 hypothetical protein QJS83_09265 [Bdellovibrio sp. 22V]
MKRVLGTLLILISLVPRAYAGKVESVQEALVKQCQRKVSNEEALSLVRSLYLSCIPGTLVKVDETCKVICLKPNSGVIGR